MPILDCDYFQHKEKSKVFKVKRKITANKLYTSNDVGNMLAMLMSKISAEAPTSALEDEYEILYGDLHIKDCENIKQVEEFTKDFKNKDNVKIKRKGE